VYVDNYPMVFLHAEALMADNETTTVIRADMRDTDEVLAASAPSGLSSPLLPLHSPPGPNK